MIVDGSSLSPADELAIAELAANACDAVRDPNAAPRFVERLCDTFGSSLAFVARHDYAAGTCQFLVHDRPMPAPLPSYQGKYAQLNPWLVSPQLQRQSAIVWRGEEFVREDQLLPTAFYRGWLEPHGLRHWLGGVIAREGDRLSYVALLRPPSAAPFSAMDGLRLRRLMPHLQIAQRLDPASSDGVPPGNLHNIAFAALERLPFGIVAFDATGAVCYVSTLAAAILKEEDGLSLRGTSLRTDSNAEASKLSDLISSKSALRNQENAGCVKALTISRPSGARPYILQIFPRVFRAAGNGAGAAGAMLFIFDPEGHSEIDGEWLRTLYGLTPAEAKLATLFSIGLSPIEAAQELGITVNTARTHLKRLYSKTGTSRQPELVHLLARLLAVGAAAPRRSIRRRDTAPL